MWMFCKFTISTRKMPSRSQPNWTQMQNKCDCCADVFMISIFESLHFSRTATEWTKQIMKTNTNKCCHTDARKATRKKQALARCVCAWVCLYQPYVLFFDISFWYFPSSVYAPTIDTNMHTQVSLCGDNNTMTYSVLLLLYNLHTPRKAIPC